jgi:hypothetical protein
VTRLGGRPPGLDDFEWRGRKDGLLDVRCWCEDVIVAVAPETVRAGLTGSCGSVCCEARSRLAVAS